MLVAWFGSIACIAPCGVEVLAPDISVELHVRLSSHAAWVQVFSARYPIVELGEEHKGSGKPSLQVCYLQHALGAGEHYNSVAPLDVSLDDQSTLQLHKTMTVTA